MEKKSKLNKILRVALILITVISLILCVPFSVSAVDDVIISVSPIDGIIYKTVRNTNTGVGSSYQGSPSSQYLHMNPPLLNLDTLISGTANHVTLSYNCKLELKKGYTYSLKLTPGYFYEYSTPIIQMWITLSNGEVLTFQEGEGPFYNDSNMLYMISEFSYTATETTYIERVDFSFLFPSEFSYGYVLCCGSQIWVTYTPSDTDAIINNQDKNTDKIIDLMPDYAPSDSDKNTINDYDSSEKDLLESSNDGISLIDSLMSGGSLVAFLADAGPAFGLISDFFGGLTFLPSFEILISASLLLGVLPAILNIADSFSRKSSRDKNKKKKGG